MEKPKILIFVPYLKGTGGTETVIKNLNYAYRESYKKKFYDMKLVSFGGTKSDHWIKGWDSKVYSFTSFRLIQLFCYAFIMPCLIMKVIYEERPTIVISTNPVIWRIAYYTKKILLLNFKIYGWYHYSLKQKRINYNSLKKCDHFLAISTGILNQLVDLGISKEKITVLNNPVILDTSRNFLYRNLENTRSTNKIEFLYVGRIDFDGQKNVKELFNSLGSVPGQWNLNLYGTCSKVDKKALMNIAYKYGFEGRVHFNGYNAHVWESVSKADTLIMTSRFEGFPMILCEAISRGIFCVSSNCETGPVDIVNDLNGKLYEPGDVSSLSKILTNIVRGNLIIPKRNQVARTMDKFNHRHFISTFEKAIGVDK